MDSIFECFSVNCLHVCVSVCVTIVRDYPPGSEGSIQATQHPEHAKPTQMFTTFIHLQELSEVGVHYWDGAADSGGRITRTRILEFKIILYFALENIQFRKKLPKDIISHLLNVISSHTDDLSFILSISVSEICAIISVQLE